MIKPLVRKIIRDVTVGEQFHFVDEDFVSYPEEGDAYQYTMMIKKTLCDGAILAILYGRPGGDESIEAFKRENAISVILTCEPDERVYVSGNGDLGIAAIHFSAPQTIKSLLKDVQTFDNTDHKFEELTSSIKTNVSFVLTDTISKVSRLYESMDDDFKILIGYPLEDGFCCSKMLEMIEEVKDFIEDDEDEDYDPYDDEED